MMNKNLLEDGFVSIKCDERCIYEPYRFSCNEVLNLYMKRHKEEIRNTFEKIIEEDFKKLTVVEEYINLVKNFEESLMELVESNEGIFDCVATENIYSFVIDKYKLKEQIRANYVDDLNKDLKELDDLYDEVNAQLSLSNDLEYQLDVLKRYGIIDKKTEKIK